MTQIRRRFSGDLNVKLTKLEVASRGSRLQWIIPTERRKCLGWVERITGANLKPETGGECDDIFQTPTFSEPPDDNDNTFGSFCWWKPNDSWFCCFIIGYFYCEEFIWNHSRERVETAQLDVMRRCSNRLLLHFFSSPYSHSFMSQPRSTCCF